VRVNGGVINSRTVMAGAEAIATKFARHKQQRHGGHINITKTFAISILRRMGFVKRKVPRVSSIYQLTLTPSKKSTSAKSTTLSKNTTFSTH
jgi:hypothetical protein